MARKAKAVEVDDEAATVAEEIQEAAETAVALEEAAPELAAIEERIGALSSLTASAYLYTTDPACTWGRGQARLAKAPSRALQLPIDLDEVQMRWGGGPYRLLIKAADGRLIGDLAFSLAGPSKLRKLMDDVQPQDRDTGEGSFWDELDKRKRGRGEDDRLTRIEKAIEQLAKGPAAPQQPSPGDAILLQLAQATVAKATTEAKAGTAGSALKEALELQDLLDELRGRKDDDEPGFMGVLEKGLPMLEAYLADRAANAPQPAQLAASTPAATPNPGPPAATPNPGPPAAAPQPKVPSSMVARLVVLLEELKEAVEEGEDVEEWAEWAVPTLGKALRKNVANDRTPLTTITAGVARYIPSMLELVKGKGKPYLVAVIEIVKQDAEDEEPPPPHDDGTDDEDLGPGDDVDERPRPPARVVHMAAPPKPEATS